MSESALLEDAAAITDEAGPANHRRRSPRRGGETRGTGAPRKAALGTPAFCADALALVTRPDFAQLATAYMLGHDAGRARDDERKRLRQALPGMLESFEEDHGRIVRAHFGAAFVAAALTDRDELTIVLGQRTTPGSDELIELLRRCEQLSYTGWHRLAPVDRRLFQRTVWSAVEDGLRQFNEPASGQAGSLAEQQAVKRLDARLDLAEDFMLRCSTRRTQSDYLKGMLWGSLDIGLLLGVTLVAVALASHVTQLAGELLLVAMAGAIGAVTSVLSRMTSGSLKTSIPSPDEDMETTDVRLVGALRPVVGLVFALAVYVLVEGAAVPIDEGTDSARTALLTGMGFLAGFSERFAQDMFVRSGQGLAGAADDSPRKGPSAGLQSGRA